MATAFTKPATLDDFLRAEAEAPEGTRLALIDGEIIEWGANMTTRGPIHSRAMSRLSFLLWAWLNAHAELVGGVDSGEVRCRLRRDPDEVVGIDVGVWLGAEFIDPPDDPPMYDAPPILAVEILSPSDEHEQVVEKLQRYLDAGVQRVWYVDPDLKTVTVHRADTGPTLFNSAQTIAADPALPGLTIAVADIFRSKSTAKPS
ncbi:MAG TPA: Uma2 family endonuclease [Planctomycetaceae bacterium]|nr:Uma2 family endonuclease [Planctomycetaceae bacterium]